MNELKNIVTEKAFLKQVIELAVTLGWKVEHVFEQAKYARRTSKGFPDLVLARVMDTIPESEVIFAELKSEKGQPTSAQIEWGHATDAFLWRPSDWPEIERVLGGE